MQTSTEKSQKATGVNDPPGTSRHWDGRLSATVVNVQPGAFFVTDEDVVISTVLGSCVAACIRDPLAGVGGLNHFMLPEDKQERATSWHARMGTDATRYGNYAMERLINELLKIGARRGRLEVKVFGGGHSLRGTSDVGGSNVSFVKEYLNLEGLRIISEDFGGPYARRVLYAPRSGKVRLKRMELSTVREVAEREESYRREIGPKPAAGSVELF